MRTIEITDVTRQPVAGKPQFILLGSEEAVNHADIGANIFLKIADKAFGHIDGFWGTLGMADNSNINWTGKLSVSNIGNEDSAGATLDEIKLIYAGRTDENNLTKVLEKVISFDDVSFGEVLPQGAFTYAQIPKLRLTIMLRSDEGALVYYEHALPGSHNNDSNGIEYIMPETTRNFNFVERDRLTYFFPIVPKNVLKEVEGTEDQFTFS